MPIYEYKAYSADGKLKKGIIEAESSKTARQKIKKSRLMVTEIQEKMANKTSKGVATTGSRVGAADISLMTRQLASLVKANIPLVESLSALVDQIDNPKLKVILTQVRQDVNEGSSLAKALTAHPKVFDNVFINMVEAGESSGTLGLVLLRLADLKEAQMRLRRKVISGMTYPVLMILVGMVLLAVIFTFVIPKITKIFDSMNKPIPATTEALIIISDFLVNQWYLVIAAGLFSFWFFQRWVATKNGRYKWDGFKLRAPIFGSLNRMIALTRFSNTMGTLLGSGVPILTSMLIARNLVGNVRIAAAIESARENITEGQSIADPLKKSGEFPPLVIHMIAIGERTGELHHMLKNVSDTYEEQVNTKIEGLASLLEPVMIIGMGGVVAFIVMSIILPLLEMSSIK